MKLKKYLTLHEISQRHFSVRLGVSESFVSRLIHGSRQPSLRMAIKIKRITKGLVTESEW